MNPFNNRPNCDSEAFALVVLISFDFTLCVMFGVSYGRLTKT